MNGNSFQEREHKKLKKCKNIKKCKSSKSRKCISSVNQNETCKGVKEDEMLKRSLK